jgi:predicted nucleotidyltransferase
MTVEWPYLLESWITPELTLRDWRERIARVEAEETAYFASLPYVRGLAVMGSVGRGTQWPLSDLDLLVVADFWEGEDPEWPIRREEAERIERLHAAGIPNDIEAGNWVLTSDDVRAAVDGDEDTFFGLLDHPHWLGVAIKAEGARVTHDFDRYVSRFVERCHQVLWTDRFVKLWLRLAGDDGEERVEGARRCLRDGDAAAASLALILAAHVMTGGMYGAWRRLPESISRGVTRFLAAAEEMGDAAVGEQFLRAARLGGDEVGERFAATPPAGQRERDVWLAIRRGNGEILDELGATRDLLHTTLWVAVTLDRSLSAPYPQWTGVTADGRIVRRQLDAAEAMLARLRAARTRVESC